MAVISFNRHDGGIGTSRRIPIRASLGLVLVATAATLRAQTFVATLGGAGDDAAQCLAQALDGGFIVAGASTSFTPPATEDDTWITRLDAEGDVQWSTVVPVPAYDNGWSVRAASDGTFLVASAVYLGRFDATGWIARLDDTGAVLWQRRLGNPLAAFMLDETPSDGGVVVVGAFEANCWLLRLDADGSVVWQRTLGDTSTTTAGRSVHATSDGGYILSGYRAIGSGRVAWAAKLDAGGNVAWQKSCSGLPGPSALLDLVPLPTGGYVGVGSNTDPAFPGSDAWVVRLDESGNALWQERFVGPQFTALAAIAPLAAGGLVAAGTISSVGDSRLTGWMVTLDDSGAIRWQQQLVSGSFSGFSGVSATRSGGIAAAGAYQEPTGFKNDLLVVSVNGDGSVAGGCNALAPTSASVSPTAVVFADMTARLADVATSQEGPDSLLTVAPSTAFTCGGATCATAPGEPSSLRVERGGGDLVVEPVTDATAYNAYVDAIGSWYHPSLATGTACRMTSWTDLIDGTIRLDVGLVPNSWVVLTSSNACGESGAGADSFGRSRKAIGTWEACPLGP